MEQLGRIGKRKVSYIQVRNNVGWEKALPKTDWVAFTITNEEDEEMVPPAVKACMDKDVSYTCNAGVLAHRTEFYFDEEVAWRGVDYEERTKNEYDYERTPISTAHKNFSEGFWFAATLAHNDSYEIEHVVCVDFTKRKVKQHLTNLIEKINDGWLPTDEEIELPVYDS